MFSFFFFRFLSSACVFFKKSLFILLDSFFDLFSSCCIFCFPAILYFPNKRFEKNFSFCVFFLSSFNFPSIFFCLFLLSIACNIYIYPKGGKKYKNEQITHLNNGHTKKAFRAVFKKVNVILTETSLSTAKPSAYINEWTNQRQTIQWKIFERERDREEKNIIWNSEETGTGKFWNEQQRNTTNTQWTRSGDRGTVRSRCSGGASLTNRKIMGARRIYWMAIFDPVCSDSSMWLV